MEFARESWGGSGQPASRAAVRDVLGTGDAAARRRSRSCSRSRSDAVNNDRSPLAFANGQYILIERTAYDAAGGHRAVRDRFVEDIALAQHVKALGLPIRVALARGIVSCRMYSSLRQLVVGWSRIFYDALDRKPWRLGLKLLDPIIFCQTGHLALVLSLVLLAQRSATETSHTRCLV